MIHVASQSGTYRAYARRGGDSRRRSAGHPRADERCCRNGRVGENAWIARGTHRRGNDCLDECATGDRSAAEQRDFLARVWREVRALPIRQRVALLLNLRDEGQQDALTLLTTAGVATHDELSACIGLSPLELTALLPDLPQDDLAIASRLGVTRRQVIHLRKCARERLTRRLGMLRGTSRPGEGS